MAANQGFFDTLKARQTAIFSAEKRSLPARLRLAALLRKAAETDVHAAGFGMKIGRLSETGS